MLDVGEDRLEAGQVAVHVREDCERLIELDGLHTALPLRAGVPAAVRKGLAMPYTLYQSI